MPYAAALSTHPVTADATGEVVGQLLEQAGRHPDLVVLAATPGHAGAMEDVAAAVRALLEPTVLLGTVAAGVGAGRAGAWGPPALAAWSATCGPVAPLRFPPEAAPSLPPLPFTPQAVLVLTTGPASVPPGRLPAAGTLGVPPGRPPTTGTLGVPPGRPPTAGTLGVPPGRPPTTGAAAGSPILLDGAVHLDGAVGALIGPGPLLRLETAEGLRPLGPPLPLERSAGGLLLRIGGASALEQLTSLARDGVAAPELATVGDGLHVAVHEAGAGPLVLAVVGMERATGGLAVDPPAAVADGATVQFLVRDPSVLAVPGGAGADGAIAFGARGHGDLLVGEGGLLPFPSLFLEAPLQLSSAGSGPAYHRQSSTIALFSDP